MEALRILHIDPSDIRCAYCGNKSTEWDHLRPIITNQEPTGYITEISDLVPRCGKCNQSKGNPTGARGLLAVLVCHPRREASPI
ncbi:MAG: HNH endonuclease [Candidatus Sulfotelmatobacter sp.]|jgi:5-methylcytosine-specific restriction endonuclease McrA